MKNVINWNQEVADIGPRLYRYFCVCFSKQEAADLVQEVLIRLVQKVREEKFNSAQGSLRMYAFGIAHFIRLEQQRIKPFFTLEQEREDETPSLADIYLLKQQRKHLRQAIALLGEEQKEVILLYIDQDLSLLEIATILHKPVNTIKSHLHRAKQFLKQSLEPQDGK